MKPVKWFGIIVLFTLLTLTFVYLSPLGEVFSALAIAFGFVFVAFLPGYCLVSILFAKKEDLDLIEESVLSVALSFALVGLSGLFLGLSPIGINFDSVRISLGAIVLVLASIAFIRKQRVEKQKAQTLQNIT